MFLRFLPIIFTLLTFLSLTIVTFYPFFFWTLFLLMPLLLLGAVFYQTGFNKKSFLHFGIIPFLFLISAFLFLLFLESIYFKFLFIILASLLVWLNLKNISFLLSPVHLWVRSAGEIYNLTSLFIIFLLASSFYYLILFFATPLWLLALGLGLVSFVLNLLAFRDAKMIFRKFSLFSLIIALIALEFFWIFSYLPLAAYLLALFLSFIFFILREISLDYVLHRLSKNIFWRSLIMAGGLFILVMVTARWF